jgi:hypothetical protein
MLLACLRWLAEFPEAVRAIGMRPALIAEAFGRGGARRYIGIFFVR